MSWKRIAAFVAGGAAVVAGALIPGAGAALISAGLGLVGLATRWPEDSRIIRAARLHGVQPDGTRVRPNGEVVMPPPGPPRPLA